MTVVTARSHPARRPPQWRGEPPPRAGSSAPVSSGGTAVPGRNKLGTIAIRDLVVSKLAARAALENPNAGSAASTVLGLTLPGAGLLGAKSTNLGALPKSSAKVDGSTATVELTISVRWPFSVATVSSEVRELVRNRVHEMTGLNVMQVQINVTDLTATIAAPPRVS